MQVWWLIAALLIQKVPVIIYTHLLYYQILNFDSLSSQTHVTETSPNNLAT